MPWNPRCGNGKSGPYPKDPIPVPGCALPNGQASGDRGKTSLTGGYRGGRKPETAFSRVLVGDRESEASWEAMLEDLLNRGLDRKSLRMVVSDAHAGIIRGGRKTLGSNPPALRRTQDEERPFPGSLEGPKGLHGGFQGSILGQEPRRSLGGLGKPQSQVVQDLSQSRGDDGRKI